ncbi:hypothetical protein [Massilia sp. NR 4-1]|uniref:hypothetical protein n=1 Tax=Massilia sp. NR 4-1 TaxID=1678028 RepID=UPI00168145F3|nr:hypothetical protein [Massilia sp. NR 4-1]
MQSLKTWIHATVSVCLPAGHVIHLMDTRRLSRLWESEEGKDEMSATGVVQKLEQAGCSFVISVPWIYGTKTSAITAEQAARLLHDRESVYAEAAGLSVSEYMEWMELGGAVLCRETTKAGRPCRNPINGGTGLEPSTWKTMNDTGGYCAVHGG